MNRAFGLFCGWRKNRVEESFLMEQRAVRPFYFFRGAFFRNAKNSNLAPNGFSPRNLKSQKKGKSARTNAERGTRKNMKGMNSRTGGFCGEGKTKKWGMPRQRRRVDAPRGRRENQRNLSRAPRPEPPKPRPANPDP
jgi:hypothetical protein